MSLVTMPPDRNELTTDSMYYSKDLWLFDAVPSFGLMTKYDSMGPNCVNVVKAINEGDYCHPAANYFETLAWCPWRLL